MRCAALEALLAIAGASLTVGSGTQLGSQSASTPLLYYPLLGTVLAGAPTALNAAAAAASRGYDDGATRAGLLLIDLALHRWRAPKAIANKLGGGACLCAAGSGASLSIEDGAAVVAALGVDVARVCFAATDGPAAPGTTLVEEAQGREALESLAGDGPAWACDWACFLLDTFFGEEEEEAEGEEE